MGNGLCIPLEIPYRSPRGPLGYFPPSKPGRGMQQTAPDHHPRRTSPPHAGQTKREFGLNRVGEGAFGCRGRPGCGKNIVLKTNVLQLFYKKYFAMLQNVRTFAPDFKSEIVPNAAFV